MNLPPWCVKYLLICDAWIGYGTVAYDSVR